MALRLPAARNAHCVPAFCHYSYMRSFSSSSSAAPAQESVAVIDLFTGAGGLTEGWHEAISALGGSTEIRASVELDEVASASYAANFLKGRAHIQHVGGIEEWLDSIPTPAADVVLGGPPCQGFSRLGKQDIDDPRNVLWKAYARTIQRAQPKYFLMENVRPFLQSPQYLALEGETRRGGMLEDYDLDVDVYRAADFGAFQNRERTVVIGRRKDMPVLDEPAKTHSRETGWRTVAEAFRDIPGDVDGIDLPARFTSKGRPGPFRSSELHLGREYSELSLKRFRSIKKGGNRFDIPDALLSECWRKRPTGLTDVMGRLHWDKPSVTIRTEFYKPEKGRYLHPEENRAITHREAARLQGFPDDFLWVGSKTAIGKQIGNAVPIQLAKAVSLPIVNALLQLADTRTPATSSAVAAA